MPVLGAVEYILDPYISSNPLVARDYYVGDDTPGFHQAVVVDTTSHVLNLPTEEYQDTDVGNLDLKFYGDWYERIHFLPYQLELGNLLSAQSRQLRIWNAYFDERQLTSFSAVNDEGITVVEPVAYPYMIKPLALVDYNVVVRTVGPAIINATLSFVVDGRTYNIPVTGTRVILWPYGPDWSTPVVESLEWLSSVQRSRDGSEQRYALREEPRRVFEFTSLVYADKFRQAQTALFGWQARVFGLPVWTEAAYLSTAHPVETSLLEVDDAAYRGFSSGFPLVIFGSYSDLETIEVLGVSGNQITLKTPTTKAWPANTKVMPVLISTLELDTGASFLTDSVAEYTTRWKAMPDQPTNVQSIAAPATHEGAEYFDRPLNWTDADEVQVQQDLGVFDNLSGLSLSTQLSDFPGVVYNYSWTGLGRAEQGALREFFFRRKGRTVPVYMPTKTTDLRLLADVGAGAQTLDVVDDGQVALMDGNLWRRDLLIELWSGAKIRRRITVWAEVSEGVSRLTLSSLLGQDVAVQNVAKISMIGLFRLASDAVTFTHITDELAQIRVPVVWTKQ